MTKQERLEYMRQRFPIVEKQRILAVTTVLTVSKQELAEEVHDMDTFREYERDKNADKEVLTSDGGSSNMFPCIMR
jgi:hypothetical protein